ncbi:hypothetical protein [Pseudomonas boanensis]|uniref:Uncharacterized protein n=1 Tax=Metapseudomonas boanensis TaxID=2822138 RepID=A0ABS5XAZ6_9GAMM|nr:hypothetical protein [Pseudomonas boanensis]MBT8764860.1 hypothetical protein [Pseudomonas boanensis]
MLATSHNLASQAPGAVIDYMKVAFGSFSAFLSEMSELTQANNGLA